MRQQSPNAQFDPRARTVVVIAGAGARGAYEAGVLAEVLPALFPHGLSNVVLLGTSAGAINAALWADRIGKGRDVRQAGREVVEVWRSIDQDSVFSIWSAPPALLRLVRRTLWSSACGMPALLRTTLARKLRSFGRPTSQVQAARTDDARACSEQAAVTGETYALLDTTPLRDTARKHLDLASLEASVDAGKLLGVGVVATSCPMDGSGGRSRVFMYAPKALKPPAADGSSIDYVWLDKGKFKHEHVLASAAIPIAFPPVQIDTEGYEGWYSDGGVRLNTPILPALDLDATQLIVVSSLATKYPRPNGAPCEKPDILDIGAQSIHVVLGDGTIEDLRSLRRMNAVVASAAQHGLTLTSQSGKPYRAISFLSVSPDNGVLSGRAQRKLQEAKKESVGYYALAAALSSAGEGSGQNELASYLLFYPPYVEAQLRLAHDDVVKRGDLARAFEQ